MRRSLTFVLLSTLGLATAFACSQKDDDDDDNRAGTGGVPPLQGSGGDQGAGNATSSGNASSQATGGQDNAQPPCDNLPLDDSCLAQAKYKKPNAVNMLVVLDKSGSMGSQGLGSGAKWDAMRSALTDAFGSAKDNPSLNMGLLLFPGKGVSSDCSSLDVESCCDVPSGEAAVNVKIAPASQSVDEILGVVNDTSPGGLTPTSIALDAAYNYFQGEGSMLEGDKYILLATDGGPNCNPALSCGDSECTLTLDGTCQPGEDCCGESSGPYWCVDHAATAAKIDSLRQLGVRTIVVGIPGSEAYADWLDSFAEAGGAAAEGGTHLFYEVSASSGVAGLTETFRDITVSLVNTCDIQLSETPPSTGEYLVNVAINCTIVPKGSSSGAAGAGTTTEANWEIDDSTSPPTLHIYGSYCEQIKEGVERLDIVIGCPPTL
jgi:hypothetical protein